MLPVGSGLTHFFEAFLEVLFGVTGMFVLRRFGQRDRDPSDTACMLAGIAVWAVIGVVVFLLVRWQGWL
jgi:hypothetical protein